jgi:hypothetical protein
MKFFGGFYERDDSCYLSGVLRHAGAFGNKMVRDGKQGRRLLCGEGINPLATEIL